MLEFDRMDAGDASLVVLSEIHRDARIITTDRRDPAIVVAGLPPGVDVRDVDGFGAAVGRAIRRA